ncbi:MAG: hypothetical protein KAV18_02840 [Candidatus Omnitrophica bacterium]|nr:hypothetical protein [Candidatus Omnitrophota bacterium]
MSGVDSKMIEINLLPIELRKKTHKAISAGGLGLPKRLMINTGIIVLFFLVSAHIALSITAMIKKGQADDLRLEWQILQPAKQNADGHIRQIQALKAREKLIKSASGVDVIWAGKLNCISDLIPAEIWLTGITLNERQRVIKPGQIRGLNARAAAGGKSDTQQILTVNGIVESKHSSKMLSPVGRFIKSLENEPLFFNDFEEIELGDVKRREINERNVMSFELICVVRDKEEQTVGPQ